MDQTDKLLQQVIGTQYRSYAIAQTPNEAMAVIKGIANNPETPYTVLEILSNHASPEVLERVAENPNTPHSVLSQLAVHPEALVRAAVADNARTPVETLWMLARDESADVRYQVAENCTLPRPIIELLTADDNPYVAFRAQITLERISAVKRQSPVARFIRRWFGTERRFQVG